jgi:hypothetical protein
VQLLLSLLILGQTTQSVISEATDYVPKYAIGWGTLAFINAGLAQGKNRSGLSWFVASLLLGPVATLLIVVLEKRIHAQH